MFNVSDTVVYGTAGVCSISEVREMSMPGKSGQGKAPRKYYVLTPLESHTTQFFVPVDNELLTAKMKRIMTKSEADAMLKDRIDYVPWIDERRTRAEEYSKIIFGGDTRQIFSVMRQLYAAKVEAESLGKKQYVTDKRNMDLAERVIGEEFSYVYELPRQGIAKYIFEDLM